MASRAPNTTILKWEDIKEIIAKGDLHILGRSEAQQKEYDEFSAIRRSEWMSISDYILHSKFNRDFYIDDVTGKKVAERIENPPLEIKLFLNDFPYYFEEGVCHYILWKLGPPLTDEEVQDTVKSMMLKHPEYSDVVIYINPPHLKSIPDIEHGHILFYENCKITFIR